MNKASHCVHKAAVDRATIPTQTYKVQQQEGEGFMLSTFSRAVHFALKCQ